MGTQLRALLAASWLLLSACTPALPPDGALSFTTIEQKNDAAHIGQQQYNALEPGLMVLDSPEASAQLGIWFSETARRELERVNFDTQLALAAFQGWQKSGGYGVTIERVVRQGERMTIFAHFTQPGPDSEPPPSVTSPYHLVLVRKAGAWPQSLTIELVVDGVVLATYPTNP